MNSAFRERLRLVFEQALALPPDKRPAFLAKACHGDAELHSEAVSLLASRDEAPDWLETHAASILPAALVSLQEQLPCNPSIKSKISHYEILEELGGDGVGLVYKARDLELDRLVALKFLPDDFSADETAQRRLRSEARAISALDHPNIAVVHEIAADDAATGLPHGGRLFIVMAYYEGETIKRKIARGPLPLGMALDFALQAADGLAGAHEAGIVHRDIKPANLLVTDRERVIIIDFGLAATASAVAAMDESGFGTAAYMSPEQTRGGPVDARTDIWSLGVTLYEMLTGRRPFHGDGDRTLARSIREDEPVPVERLRPELSSSVSEVIRRCLAKDPFARYPRCEDLVVSLQRIAADEAHARNRGRRSPRRTPISQSPTTSGSIASVRRGLHENEWSEREAASVSKREGDLPALPQLAVLPFSNRHSDADSDFLGYALADEIIGRLGYVRGLITRPSSAVSKYQGKIVDARTVSKDLGVEYVLSGSYSKDGSKLCLDLELVQTDINEAVWRDSVKVAYDSLLDLHDRVAQKICGEIVLGLTREEQSRIERDAPSHSLAYHYYLWALAQPIGTKDGLRSSFDMLNRSVELDSSFAPAFAALGYRSYMLAHVGYVAGHPRSRMLARAEHALREALRLNPELLSALGYLALFCLETGRIEEAWNIAQRALKINLNSADVWISLGHVYRFAGMFDESERAFSRGRALEPHSPRLLASGLTYLYQGKYNEALEIFSPGEPYTPFSLLWQGMAFLGKGDTARARRSFDAAVAIQATSTARWVAEAHLAYMAREFEKGLAAVRALERMFASTGDGGEALHHYGRLYVALGDSTSGTAMIERAIDHGFYPYPWLRVDRFLDLARGEVGFDRVLAKAEVRHGAFKKRLSRDTQAPTRS